MISRPIIQALAFAAPAVGALVCMVIMILDASYSNKNRSEKQLRLSLSLTCILSTLCWSGLVFQVTNPDFFVYYHSLFLLTLMMGQVLIYRFVYIITNTEKYDAFSRLHYVLPTIMTIVSVVCAIVIPFEEQKAAIYGGNSHFSWFDVLYTGTGLIFISYNTFYPILGLMRMRRYKQKIDDYSADKQRTSLDWLILLQSLSLICIPVPVTGMLLHIDVFNDFWSSMQGVVPTFFICPIMCYNLLTDNFVIIEPENESPTEKYVAIDPKRFVRYLRDKKPYLNPKLRVTDVAFALNTNRSYTSAFINKEYGLNFSRFINRCRLDELDRLRQLPRSKSASNMDLVLMAGFSSYRSYVRAKSEEDRNRVLKVFA